jgi:hypothetical protein
MSPPGVLEESCDLPKVINHIRVGHGGPWDIDGTEGIRIRPCSQTIGEHAQADDRISTYDLSFDGTIHFFALSFLDYCTAVPALLLCNITPYTVFQFQDVLRKSNAGWLLPNLLRACTTEAQGLLHHLHAIWQSRRSYHDPEAFRANLNATIEALKNVTFVRQNEKRRFTAFDRWYGAWRAKPCTVIKERGVSQLCWHGGVRNS